MLYLGSLQVVTWGAIRGTCPSGHVVALKATAMAYAALLADGSVVAWGEPYFGGPRGPFSRFRMGSIMSYRGFHRLFIGFSWHFPWFFMVYLVISSVFTPFYPHFLIVSLPLDGIPQATARPCSGSSWT